MKKEKKKILGKHTGISRDEKTLLERVNEKYGKDALVEREESESEEASHEDSKFQSDGHESDVGPKIEGNPEPVSEDALVKKVESMITEPVKTELEVLKLTGVKRFNR